MKPKQNTYIEIPKSSSTQKRSPLPFKRDIDRIESSRIQNIPTNAVPFLEPSSSKSRTENLSRCDRRGLRSYWHLRTHRPLHTWLHGHRNRAASLVGHVGLAPPAHRPVAHPQGSRGDRRDPEEHEVRRQHG